MHIRSGLLLCAVLLGCAVPEPAPANDPPPLGRGYRSPEDACRIVGETAFTNQFLDDASHLVGCPEAYDGHAAFEADTGGRLVAHHQGYRLYVVPVR